MAKFTIELVDIINSNFDLGLKDYECINEEYRARLNNKILNHYMFHEIGFETPNKFRHYLNVKMDEIMPYYNKLLETDLITINPLLSFQKSHTQGKNKEITNESEQNITNNVDTTKNNTETLNLKDTKTLDLTNTNTVDLTDTKTLDLTDTNVVALTDTETLNTVNNIEQLNNSENNSNVANDTTNTQTNNTTDTTRNTGTTTVDNKDIFSDTPQALITDTNLSNLYASNARIVDNLQTDNTTKTVTGTGTITNVNNNDIVSSETKTDSITGSNATTGTNVLAKTGDETLTKTGTDTVEKTGTETLKNVGTDIVEKTGTDINAETGSIDSVGKTTFSNTNNEVESITITENGFNVPLSDLIIKYRQTFLNIDVLIINELKELFMMVY